MRLKPTILAAAVAATFGFAAAQPSEYFLWKHTTSGKTVCEVTRPDVNWAKVAGPFEDPNCKYKMPR